MSVPMETAEELWRDLHSPPGVPDETDEAQSTPPEAAEP